MYIFISLGIQNEILYMYMYILTDCTIAIVPLSVRLSPIVINYSISNF